MYSNKNEGPRRGRSFDSMNIGFEEKLLNNEVRDYKTKKSFSSMGYFKTTFFFSVTVVWRKVLMNKPFTLSSEQINLSRFVVM